MAALSSPTAQLAGHGSIVIELEREKKKKKSVPVSSYSAAATLFLPVI